jgi:hypothetical protein
MFKELSDLYEHLCESDAIRRDAIAALPFSALANNKMVDAVQTLEPLRYKR